MFRILPKRFAFTIALILTATCSLTKQASADFVQQGFKLRGTAASALSYQGDAVAISADGSTAVIGASRDSSDVGGVWVFVRSNGQWTQQGNKLFGSYSVSPARQGGAVAISANGNAIVVGGEYDNNGVGAAWVFTRQTSDSPWSFPTRLVASNSIGQSYQGQSVAISGDGNTILVGGDGDDSSKGAVWAYTRSTGGPWSASTKLNPMSIIGNAGVGTSVALSSDGTTALVGGANDNGTIGATWVFRRGPGPSGVWGSGTKFVATGAIGNARQGSSVALSADGKTGAIGGRNDNANVGAVWIVSLTSGSATQQIAKLAGTGYSGNPYQGSSVSLSGNGDTLLSGGEGDNSSIGTTWVFSRSGNVWSQQGNKLVGASGVGASSQGHAVALAADGSTAIVGGYTDASGAGAAWTWVLRPAHDLSGDGSSDILWRNTAGDVTLWLMNGSAASSVAGLGNVGPNWTMVAQRDFNGDSKSDILWASSAGDIAMWLMSGATATSVASLGNIGANWSLVATADFNGDGKGDILWRNGAGDIVLWLMNGTSASQVVSLGNISTNWGVAGTADFNSDGKSDILWRDTSGNIVLWLMNGASASQVASLGNVGTNWAAVGTADFNGDGKGDILWRNTSGDIVLWLMNGTSASSVASLGNIGTEWSVASNGDYNGDGKGDILWRSTTGDIALWLMNGTAISSVASLGNVATNWTIQNANAN